MPAFQFENINSYRLSWNELSLLNNISIILDNIDHSYSNSLRFTYILNYLGQNNLDIIYQNSFFPVTISSLTCSLYMQKQFTEVLQTSTQYCNATLYHSPFFQSLCLGCYCQTLGETQQYDQAKKYTYYAVSLLRITEYFPNAALLEKFMKEDFDILI